MRVKFEVGAELPTTRWVGQHSFVGLAVGGFGEAFGNFSGGNATVNFVGRNVLRHNRTGGDNGPASDADSGHDDCAAADPRVGLDDGWFEHRTA